MRFRGVNFERRLCRSRYFVLSLAFTTFSASHCSRRAPRILHPLTSIFVDVHLESRQRTVVPDHTCSAASTIAAAKPSLAVAPTIALLCALVLLMPVTFLLPRNRLLRAPLPPTGFRGLQAETDAPSSAPSPAPALVPPAFTLSIAPTPAPAFGQPGFPPAFPPAAAPTSPPNGGSGEHKISPGSRSFYPRCTPFIAWNPVK